MAEFPSENKLLSWFSGKWVMFRSKNLKRARAKKYNQPSHKARLDFRPLTQWPYLDRFKDEKAQCMLNVHDVITVFYLLTRQRIQYQYLIAGCPYSEAWQEHRASTGSQEKPTRSQHVNQVSLIRTTWSVTQYTVGKEDYLKIKVCGKTMTWLEGYMYRTNT